MTLIELRFNIKLKILRMRNKKEINKIKTEILKVTSRLEDLTRE